MSKRKVLIETINHYYGCVHGDETDWVAYEVMLKVNGGRHAVEVEVTSKDNPGGQVWDWATSNWDRAIPEDGPTITVLVESVSVEVATKLRWACITGVYDSKGRPLPIKEISYTTSKNRAYAKKAKEKRGKTLEPVKIKAEPKTKGFSAKKAKPVDKPKEKPAPEVFDFEAYKQAKIQKAMEKEE